MAGIQYFEAVDRPEVVIDTNGAGDGLAVGFLSGYFLEGLSLLEAIQGGQLVARYSCTQKGSSDRLMTPEKPAYWADNQ